VRSVWGSPFWFKKPQTKPLYTEQGAFMFSRKPSTGLFDPRQVNQAWPEPNVDTNIPYTWGLSGYKHLGYPTPTDPNTLLAEPTVEDRTVFDSSAVTASAFLEAVGSNKITLTTSDQGLVVDPKSLEDLPKVPTPPVVIQTQECECPPPKGTQATYTTDQSSPVQPTTPNSVDMTVVESTLADNSPYLFSGLCASSAVFLLGAAYEGYRLYKNKSQRTSSFEKSQMSAGTYLAFGSVAGVTALILKTTKVKTLAERA
jgi:hypothetical protein